MEYYKLSAGAENPLRIDHNAIGLEKGLLGSADAQAAFKYFIMAGDADFPQGLTNF